MPTLDLKAQLRDATLRAQRLLTNDLKAISADQVNACPGGCARTALNIVAECAAVNGMAATVLSGAEYKRPSPEEREAHLNSFDTVDKVIAYLDQETERLLAAIEATDADTFSDEMSPFGRPMNRFGVASLPSWHMMYHDGQLNYIQSLHGDGEMHWG
jgi:hypothetical protein